MVRGRWKLVVGLALIVGCTNPCGHRFGDRLRGRNDLCCMESPSCCENGTFGDSGPLLPAPSGPGMHDAPLGPPPTPLGVPPGTPPPGQRLVPQPQGQPSLQPVPFNPNQPPR